MLIGIFIEGISLFLLPWRDFYKFVCPSIKIFNYFVNMVTKI